MIFEYSLVDILVLVGILPSVNFELRIEEKTTVGYRFNKPDPFT